MPNNALPKQKLLSTQRIISLHSDLLRWDRGQESVNQVTDENQNIIGEPKETDGNNGSEVHSQLAVPRCIIKTKLSVNHFTMIPIE